MSDDLFSAAADERFDEFAPLAARMRPRTIDEFVGQSHIMGSDGPLKKLIESDSVRSVILWGPPGTGKTSLAQIVASLTSSNFVRLSAVDSGVKDVRSAISQAKGDLGMLSARTIVFIDEIHRFNKAQQDALLRAVENGWIVLIGATTENPFFEVNSPLISRSLLFRLEPLDSSGIREIIDRALAETERGLGSSGVAFEDEALEFIVDRAGGDARFALNALELCAALDVSGSQPVTADHVADALQRRKVRYDKGGDAHYDVISAFIKSMRGSDPDAAVWWLAHMLEAGEDPKFIARRMVIFASEDVGNADPKAIQVAVSAFQALEFVGLPEAGLNLTQAATYLACAPKSNASARALWKASSDIRSKGAGEIPEHLSDSSYPGAARLGHGKGYQYPHDQDDAWVDQQYLPDHVDGTRYYEPTEFGDEADIRKRLERLRSASKRSNRKSKE